MEVTQEEVQTKKKNIFAKHYLLSSFIIVYILTVLAHILGVNVSMSLAYIGNISLGIAIIFIIYSSIKSEENAKLGKKVLSAVISFVIAIFILSLSQTLAKKTILGAQDTYVKQESLAWSKELKVFAENNDLEDLLDTEIEKFVSQDYYDKFAAKFNASNKLIYLFMIKKQN